MRASRADWSVFVTRLGSRNNRSWPPLNSHCQGWLLCSDGARHADDTASLMTSVSTTVAGISRPPDLYLPSRVPRIAPSATGPLVLDPSAISPCPADPRSGG